jgi:hypothetical protein
LGVCPFVSVAQQQYYAVELRLLRLVDGNCVSREVKVNTGTERVLIEQ